MLLNEIAFILSYQKFNTCNRINNNILYNSKKKLSIYSSKEKGEEDINIDSIFGSEFVSINTQIVKPPTIQQEEQDATITFKKGERIVYPKRLPTEKRNEIMKGFQNAKVTFLVDSIFVSLIGLCLTWYFGTFKDSYSYGIGSILGLAYAVLLGRYVEGLNTAEGSAGGSARFAPVILLIALYGKNRDTISILPELLGFFSYQVGSFLQIFNEDLYGEGDKNDDDDDDNDYDDDNDDNIKK